MCDRFSDRFKTWINLTDDKMKQPSLEFKREKDYINLFWNIIGWEVFFFSSYNMW